MNKDEKKMIEEMAEIIYNKQSQCIMNDCEDCGYFGRYNCSSIKKATALYNANCRIISEDEIVVKKSEQKQWLKDFIESNKKTEEIIRKETAREILKLIEYYDIEHPVFTRSEVFERVATKYGIE